MIRRAQFTSACIVLLISAFPSIATSSSHTLSTLSTAPFDPYVHRSNFIVGDLDRALRIYRDILGFKVNVVLPVQKENFMRSIFQLPPEAKMRIAFLSGAKGQFGHIGITEVKGADISSSEGGPFPSVLILEVQRDL